jgi:hypothetical protein
MRKLASIQRDYLYNRVKNAVFWDITPCGSCKIRRFGGTYRLHCQGDKNILAFLRSLIWLLVTANDVLSLPIVVTLIDVPPKRRFLLESHGITC